MQRSKYDLWVGFFVMLGIASIVFLALKVGNLVNLSFEKTYTFNAQFSNIGSVKPGSSVKNAGVVVGRVRDVTLDNTTHQAVAIIELESRFAFPKDSTLNIVTSGLLGEEYVAITAGADPTTIEQAVTLAGADALLITRTQPSVSIGETLSQIMPGSDGNQPLLGGTYFVNARFTNLGSIKEGSAVKSAGVVIGRVRGVTFNAQVLQAVVSLELESKYAFPSDSSLRIMSSGLIGGQYIDISAGFEEESLEQATQAELASNKAPFTIVQTQSAIVLEDLIGQLLYSMGDSGAKDSDKPKNAE